ncbi:anaphase-promoting complex binding [Rhizoctonia solani]|uniref:Anaphase-promoting complex binding n=1 Tax=Rhizoctonia solani TaxID=456999 RepID=A0A8H7IJ89_9AGAM|nr:anaphase-promoting complex binding [Rhizoctonia solani]
MFASGSYDSTVIAWDAYTGARLVGPIKAHDDKTLSVCFSLTASISFRGPWTIPHVSGTHAMAVSYPTPSHVTLIQSYNTTFFPGDRYIACGLDSDECPMVILSTSTGEQAPGWHVQQGSPMRVISFSPDCKHAVTGHNSGDVRAQRLDQVDRVLAKRKQATDSLGRWTVYAWDLQSGHGNPWLFGKHQEDVCCVVFSPDGTRAISCSSDRTVKLWNALQSISCNRQPWKPPASAVWSVAVSPDGSRIAAASGDHALYMFNAHDGSTTVEPLVAHTAEVLSVAFSHDGSNYPTPSRAHGQDLVSFFLADGRWVVSASSDKTMRIRGMGDDTLIASELVAAHENRVYSASFSFDGKRVVSGCADRTIRVWDPQTLSLLLDPFGSQTHTGEINSVTFSPDDRLIASGSFDCTICVFDSYTGHLVLGPLSAHTDWVRSVVFSPDGAHIVSGSDDRTVRVWSVKDGAAVCEPNARSSK